jgi:hypothetical protein
MHQQADSNPELCAVLYRCFVKATHRLPDLQEKEK